MKPDQESARKALLNARQALQRGDRQVARGWAQQAVALDPDSETPWLFLAAVASPRASIYYLEQAQKINPHSQSAQQGMQWAVERLEHEQAKQSSKLGTPPGRGLIKDLRPTGITQDASRKPAASESRILFQMQKNPVKVSRSVSSAELQLSRASSGHRWSRSFMRFISHWQNWVGTLLVGFFLFVALAAPLISPNALKSPNPFMRVKGASLADPEPHSPLLAPPLGTLPGQYDVFHALVWGTRDALAFGLEVVILTGIFGVFFGAISGYVGGAVNNIMMRIADAFLAFPIIAGIVLLNQLWVSVTVASGGFFDSYHNTWIQNVGKLTSFLQVLMQAVNPLLLILILFSWMPYARITNAVVSSLKQAEFIQAARSIGARSSRIILRHLLPNSVTPSIVLAARDVGSMVILQATFTFIGLDGSSTWGKMLVMGKDWIIGPGGSIFHYWWVYVPATLVLILFGIGWNLVGDGLGELLDPRDGSG